MTATNGEGARRCDQREQGTATGSQNPDEQLREMICGRLMEDSRIDTRDVGVGVQDGRVTLEGSIDNRMAKYQVEVVIESLGVTDVQNNLRISGSAGADADGGAGMPEKSSQTGSSGGVSSLGLSASGSMGDRTSTGASTAGDTPSDGSEKPRTSST